MRRAVTVLPLLAILAACAGCGGTSHALTHPIGPTTTTKQAFQGFVLKPAAAAPGFALHDQSGRVYGPSSLRGTWFVVAFLYTHCPDVCPLIANNLGIAQRALPSLGVLAVSVDPKGDTHAAVKRFIAAHDLTPRFHYLTGTRAQLAPVWAHYHIAATGGPHSTVSHSAFELLVDPQGRERVLFDSQLRSVDVIKAVKTLS